MKFKPINNIVWATRLFLTSLAIFFCITAKSNAIPINYLGNDPAITPKQQQAIEFIDKINKLNPSPFWPNIKPDLFLQNLKTNIHQPISIYTGNGTYFCGYGAITYLLLQDDPLGYAKLLIQLYEEGKATFGKSCFNPSLAVKKQAGLLNDKGILDINPAEQMWYLSLADHFKGYLNIFNRKYDPNDESSFWASVNYAKFNRMARSLLHYKISARGSDIFRPGVKDLYKYINEKMKTGYCVLYINNRIVHKKNHTSVKLDVPTHFIVVDKISEMNDVITLVYWDYGSKTQIQVTPSFFKKIIFGITCCDKKETDDN